MAGFKSAGEANPYIVVDNLNIKLSDNQKWFHNYENLPRELRFYIDQTKLRKYIGLVYLYPIKLIEGNTLGFPKQERIFYKDFDPQVLLKEFYFTKPKFSYVIV